MTQGPRMHYTAALEANRKTFLVLSFTVFEPKRLGYQPWSQTARWKRGIIPHCMNDPPPEGHMASYIGRRELLAALGGAAVAWPLAARAQQPERMRRIGALMSVAADDPEAPARVGAFSQGLAELGWTIGRNVRIDYRWFAGDADTARKYAVELVALAPDVVLASGTQGVMAIQQVNRPVPVVFALVADPVGAGFVESLARPGGNATGFMLYEYSISGKWLELLKEIAPGVTRVAVLRDPSIPTGPAQFSTIQALAPCMSGKEHCEG
jgi:putative ABC transport system substrate-binding protein